MPWIASSSGKSGVGEGRIMVGAGPASSGAGWALAGGTGVMGLLGVGCLKAFLMLAKAFESLFFLGTTSGSGWAPVSTGIGT